MDAVCVTGVSAAFPQRAGSCEPLISDAPLEELHRCFSRIRPIEPSYREHFAAYSGLAIDKIPFFWGRIESFEALKTPESGVSERIRQVSNLSNQLAISVGLRAVDDAKCRGVDHTRTGVIYGTSFGIDDHSVQDQVHRTFVAGVVHAEHHLAALLQSKGPTIVFSAACASTALSMCQALMWIQSGACDRVVVVAADLITHEPVCMKPLPGFFRLGVIQSWEKEEDVFAPFNDNPHGVVFSSGAVGFVLEKASLLKKAIPERRVYARLQSGLWLNAGTHPLRLDVERMVSLLQETIKKAGLTPKEVAESCVYFALDTGASSCCSAEASALRLVFGDDLPKIIISHTKWQTGHAMSPSYEHIATLSALYAGRISPMPPGFVPGKAYHDLTFAHEAMKKKVRYGLVFGGGFGAYLAYCLYEITE
eukprot:TRINITY_DN3704_c0_g1_i1.p1 TRINITY_DN3704_c0_g1~~TRINITY_DN3704_c0_g1_i1.p1  ORF type:complete len:464 (-),score=108.38 TRINITY_DN3704_c0_g1_i1:904-2169(-)